MAGIGAAALALAAGACSSPLFATGEATIGSAEVISLVTSDKTIGDHIISLYSGKNCSTLRVENDLTYCVEDEPRPQKNGYCYRTIGSVTCYDRPDPHNGGYQEVEQKTEGLVRRR
jgi:hypothetical protein